MTEPEKKFFFFHVLFASLLFLLNPLSAKWDIDFKVGCTVGRAHLPECAPLEKSQQQCHLNRYRNDHFEIREVV